jgi:hypothetical protein
MDNGQITQVEVLSVVLAIDGYHIVTIQNIARAAELLWITINQHQKEAIIRELYSNSKERLT